MIMHQRCDFVCVLINKIYKTYRPDFSFCCLGHARVPGLVGARGSKIERGDLRWPCISCMFCFSLF